MPPWRPGAWLPTSDRSAWWRESTRPLQSVRRGIFLSIDRRRRLTRPAPGRMRRGKRSGRPRLWNLATWWLEGRGTARRVAEARRARRAHPVHARLRSHRAAPPGREAVAEASQREVEARG